MHLVQPEGQLHHFLQLSAILGNLVSLRRLMRSDKCVVHGMKKHLANYIPPDFLPDFGTDHIVHAFPRRVDDDGRCASSNKVGFMINHFLSLSKYCVGFKPQLCAQLRGVRFCRGDKPLLAWAFSATCSGLKVVGSIGIGLNSLVTASLMKIGEIVLQS